MKKKLVSALISLVVLVIGVVYSLFAPNSSETVQFIRVVDGDTAIFNLEGEEVKVRFYLVDTPETTTSQPYSQKAKEFTENYLQNATEIILESDDEEVEYDNYGRRLAWVFVDGLLLQEELAKQGYVVKLYDPEDNTRYLKRVEDGIQEAKDHKRGIYS